MIHTQVNITLRYLLTTSKKCVIRRWPGVTTSGKVGVSSGNPQNPERFLFFKSLLSSSIIVINSVLFASFWPYLKRHTPWPQHGFRLKIKVLQSRTPFAGGHADFMSMVWGKVANQHVISESYQSHISHVCLFVFFCLFPCFFINFCQGRCSYFPRSRMVKVYTI